MTSSDAQKSEVHDTTDDAATSPVATNELQSGLDRPKMPHGEIHPMTVTLADATIVRDDTDAGGPLILTSNDPELNPPRVPIDPFPTDGTPQIDVPVDRP